jgi:hypothetical protein
MRLEAAGQHPFRREIQPRAISKQVIVMLFGQGIHGSRGCAVVARMDRHFHLGCVHLGGEARLIHRDKEVFLRRGDVFLIDTPADLRWIVSGNSAMSSVPSAPVACSCLRASCWSGVCKRRQAAATIDPRGGRIGRRVWMEGRCDVWRRSLRLRLKKRLCAFSGVCPHHDE